MAHRLNRYLRIVDGRCHPPRPLWLLPTPRRIEISTLLGPPERIKLGWWEGEGAPRDYFVASDGDVRSPKSLETLSSNTTSAVSDSPTAPTMPARLSHACRS